MNDITHSFGKNIGPTKKEDRIDILDFLRGFAVLGIVAANIIAFGQPMAASIYPGAFKVESGDPDGWLWMLQFILIDGKMRAIFSILFGAGLYLFVQKAKEKGAGIYLQVWRLVILLAAGAFHYLFIWSGDILTYYAIFGLAALPLIGMKPKSQLILGLAGYAIGALVYVSLFTGMFMVAEASSVEDSRFLEEKTALETAVKKNLEQDRVLEDAISSGDYGQAISFQVKERAFHQIGNASFVGLETLPLILIGIGLFRLGFFAQPMETRKRNLAFGFALTLAVGIHVLLAIVVKSYGFSYFSTTAAVTGWSAIPRLIMALSLMGLFIVNQNRLSGYFSRLFRNAGKTAFTNYIGTSILMMFVFHGWGLGLYGELNRPQLYAIVLLTWIIMLTWPIFWLNKYRHGPLEWAWRCLTYRKIIPNKIHIRKASHAN